VAVQLIFNSKLWFTALSAGETSTAAFGGLLFEVDNLSSKTRLVLLLIFTVPDSNLAR
jgi:hypothetical protein